MYSSEVRMNLIDTPGFDDTDLSEYEILTDLQYFVNMINIRLSGILFLHDAGVSIFKDIILLF